MNFRVTEKAPRIAPSFVLDLQVDVMHTFETRNLSKGCDTVLVILDDATPVDWNDDRDGRPKDKRLPRESLLKFAARRRAPFTLQVRAKDGTLEGKCDVYMDNKLLAKQIAFGAPYKRAKREPMEMPRHYRSPPEIEPDIYELPTPDRHR